MRGRAGEKKCGSFSTVVCDPPLGSLCWCSKTASSKDPIGLKPSGKDKGEAGRASSPGFGAALAMTGSGELWCSGYAPQSVIG